MSQIPEPSPNAAQVEYWNAIAGETWAQFQEPLDRQIEPLGLAAIDVLQPAPGERIIDIGCGCGQTSLALAARVAPSGSVVGIDLSRPMLEVARRGRARRQTCAWTSGNWTHKTATSAAAFSTPPSPASA